MDRTQVQTRAIATGAHDEEADVVVLGAGASGVATAIAAARAGARTVLVEAGPMPGGELLSGMAIDGALNGRGEWVLGGVGRKLVDDCRSLGGFAEALCDFRLIWYVCLDPEVMKVAVVRALAQAGVRLLLHTVAVAVETDGPRLRALHVQNKSGRTRIGARWFVDCSGDAELVRSAGGEVLHGGPAGEMQPVSMMFRMAGVQSGPLLRFQQEQPLHFALGESDAIRQGRSDPELASAAAAQGHPTVFLKGDGPLLGQAIESGEMYPTALVMIQPTAPRRGEVCLNTTRVGGVDGTDTGTLSTSLATLAQQALQCVQFMQKRVPGFEQAAFSGLSHRVGVRETRRIAGRESLAEADVLQARKRPDGIAKGSHHVDIHQSGVGQVRIPVRDGGSYDIPWGCLLPPAFVNVVAAGRVLSSDRGANGSARVMGPCMGMGHAAGLACAMALQGGLDDIATLDVQKLRTRLAEEGAVLDGTW